MYIFSGIYKGLSGKLLSEGQSWLEIDNPNITKKVHCSYCQVIDDGKADLEAIEKFYKKRKWMPPIKGQAGRIKKVGGVDNQSNRNAVHGSSLKEKRELAKLQDFNKPGLHYLPLERSTDEEDVNQSLRSRYNTKEVIKRSWDEKKKSGGGHFISEQPALYCSIPTTIATLAEKVKQDLLQQFESGWNGSSDLVEEGAYKVDPNYCPGYYKGRLTNETSLKFEDCIPSSFELKESASQIGIVFLNTQDGQCDTHFDRDSSILYLASGCKEVRIAPPMNEIGFADGILQDVNPFSSDESEHGGFSWTTIHMGPGSSLFIPKYWLHCIKSVGNPQTLALSFQVLPTLGQINTPVKRAWTSQDISAVAEESQSVVDLLSENEDECNICGEGGKLICCDNCPLAYHEECLEVNGDSLPDDWQCPSCVVKKGGDDKKMSVEETNSRKRKRTKKNDGSESTSRKRGRSLVSSVLSEMSSTTSSKRSSSRRRLVCGICNVNGFNQFGGREMVREHLPMYITRPQNVFDTHMFSSPTSTI